MKSFHSFEDKYSYHALIIRFEETGPAERKDGNNRLRIMQHVISTSITVTFTGWRGRIHERASLAARSGVQMEEKNETFPDVLSGSMSNLQTERTYAHMEKYAQIVGSNLYKMRLHLEGN